MPRGRVKWFDEAKSYGFITLVTGSDAFAHYSAIAMDDFKKPKESVVV